MPTDHPQGVNDGAPEVAAACGAAVDRGLLTPVAPGADAAVSDAEFAGCLVAAEVALARAWHAVGVASADDAEQVSRALGWRGSGSPCDLAALRDFRLDHLIASAVAGGNPVIPLVGVLREGVPEGTRQWVHRGATSQDIMDSALMLLALRAGTLLLQRLGTLEAALSDFARDQRDHVSVARTLTQHAVPTTVGLRASGWLRGVRRARRRLADIVGELPAQLAGASGTLASFVEIGGAEAAAALPAAFARELGLSVPDGPWHTVRWPITELGDALTQTIDAFGVIAADVATLSRSEIGELAEGEGGGSSAMPQKQNPVRSVLIRSAAIRAPQLAATLHTAAALAVDERPDGAWHAEWPTLRELLRIANGSASHAVELVLGLQVDAGAVRRNLGLGGGLVLAERIALVLGPVLGADRVKLLVAQAAAGGDLADLLRAELQGVGAQGSELQGSELQGAAAGIDVDALLDPELYLGLAGAIVDQTVQGSRETQESRGRDAS